MMIEMVMMTLKITRTTEIAFNSIHTHQKKDIRYATRTIEIPFMQEGMKMKMKSGVQGTTWKTSYMKYSYWNPINGKMMMTLSTSMNSWICTCKTEQKSNCAKPSRKKDMASIISSIKRTRNSPMRTSKS